MAWTTPEQVLALTGETVDAQHCAVASAMIDTKTGASEDLPEDTISGRDRRILGRAAAWQAPWVKARPWLITQPESTRQTSAAGVSDRRDSDTAIMYAPMAILEMRNLSWVGTRTEIIRPVGERLGRLNFLNERSDVCGTWTPL
jgi:hypothetical protein